MGFDFQLLFRKLLSLHSKVGYLRDKRIQKILSDIPLELLFSPDQLKRFILQDAPVLFYYRDENNVRTVSAPHMISMMTSMLELDEHDRALILGSKGGLIEAVIAKASKDVFIVEEHDEVAAITEDGFIKLGLTNIWVRRQNPIIGLGEEAPFNKILITGAIPFLPHGILDQLAVGGILVMPLMLTSPDQQTIIQVRKHEDELEIVNFGGVIFQPLYMTAIPEIDPNLDLSFQRLMEIAKETEQPDLITHKDFFEEFTEKMAKVEIQQIVFAANDQISFALPCSQIELDALPVMEFKTYTDLFRANFREIPLKVYLFNPEKRAATVRIEYHPPVSTSIIMTELIKIPAQDQREATIILKVPLLPKEEKSYTFSCKVMDPNKYRIAHLSGTIHVFPTLNQFDLSLEFESMHEDEDSEDSST